MSPGTTSPAAAGEVVARLRAAFAAAADPEYAAGAASYMRGQFPFLGLRTPARRRLARAALAGLAPPTEPQLRATLDALWRQPERQFQHAGCDYLRAHVSRCGPGFLPTIRRLVTTKAWWDTVDAIAAHCAGPLVRRHPELAAVMDRWVLDEDVWVARTAILHQLAWKEATDAERLFRYCRLRAGDCEFFIRKAIGWALRTYAAVDAGAVRAFVAATPELSRLSVREATKGVLRAERAG